MVKNHKSKEAVLIVIVLLFAYLSLQGFEAFVEGRSIVLLVLGGIGFCALLLVGASLVRWWFLLLTVVAVVFFSFRFFSLALSPLFASGAGILMSSLLLASWQMKRESANQVRSSTWKLLREGAWVIALSVAFFFGILYYLLRGFSHQQELKLPPSFLFTSSRVVAPVLGVFMPGFNIDMNLDQLLRGITIGTQLPSGGSVRPIKDIAQFLFGADLSQEIESASLDVVEQLKHDLSNTIGIPLTGREKMLEVLAMVINHKLNDALQPYQAYLPLFLLFLVFLLVYAISFPLRWAALAVGVGIFFLLKISHFVTIETRQVAKEEMVL